MTSVWAQDVGARIIAFEQAGRRADVFFGEDVLVEGRVERPAGGRRVAVRIFEGVTKAQLKEKARHTPPMDGCVYLWGRHATALVGGMIKVDEKAREPWLEVSGDRYVDQTHVIVLEDGDFRTPRIGLRLGTGADMWTDVDRYIDSGAEVTVHARYRSGQMLASQIRPQIPGEVNATKTTAGAHVEYTLFQPKVEDKTPCLVFTGRPRPRRTNQTMANCNPMPVEIWRGGADGAAAPY
ncbi:MAG TPA: hypothetical protein VGK29_14170 [Paludibaculum sp.]